MYKKEIILGDDILQWELARDAVTLSLWLHLLLMADNEGKIEATVRQLSILTGSSDRQIRTRLEYLSNDKLIDKQTTNKNSVITILHYDSYKHFEKDNVKQTTNKTTNKKETEKAKEKTPYNPLKEKEKEKEKSTPPPYTYVCAENIPDLTETMIERIQMMLFRQHSKLYTPEDIKLHYEDYKSREVDEHLIDNHRNWFQHFKNYITKRINESIEKKHDRRRATDTCIPGTYTEEDSF